jgi:hypothetical protein
MKRLPGAGGKPAAGAAAGIATEGWVADAGIGGGTLRRDGL